MQKLGMNVELFKLLFKIQDCHFNDPVFAAIYQYLQVNTAGMENTYICQHFANLALNFNGRSVL